jgi:uncharacterized protein YjbI with pentapeptide repeats
LTDAQLVNANLKKAEMERAVLRGADLTRASLSDAYLRLADLRGASIDRVDFHRAILRNTDFRGVDLTSTVGLTQDQLADACGDQATKIPDGLDRAETWPSGQG